MSDEPQNEAAIGRYAFVNRHVELVFNNSFFEEPPTQEEVKNAAYYMGAAIYQDVKAAEHEVVKAAKVYRAADTRYWGEVEKLARERTDPEMNPEFLTNLYLTRDAFFAAVGRLLDMEGEK